MNVDGHAPTAIPTHLADVSYAKFDQNGERFYEIKEDAVISEPIFLRNPTTILGCENNFTRITWMTISQANVRMVNVTYQGLLQVTAKGGISAENCDFSPSNTTNQCIIEVFSQSSCSFTKCKFSGATKVALVARDRAKVSIIDCNFENNEHSSLLLMDSAEGKVERSRFSGSKKFAVYVYRKSKLDFHKCEFIDTDGKGVFMLSEAKSSFNDCSFVRCKGGAIFMSDQSEAEVNGCKFDHINASSIHCMKNSKSNIINSIFKNCSGNGINFDFSGGSVSLCQFENFKFPVFAVSGPNANPIIQNCTLENLRSFGCAVRDGSNPTFENLSFMNGKTHCFSLSCFSNSVVRNCRVSKFKGAAFAIYDGAKSQILNNTVADCQIFGLVFTEGSADFIGNVISEPMKIIRKMKGSYLFESNRILEKEAMVEDSMVVPSGNPINTLLKFDSIAPKPFDISNLIDNPLLPQFDSQICKCLKCGTKNASLYCSPCGHRVVCDTCAKDCKECPLCSSYCSKCVHCYRADKCLICFNESDTMLFPCGHANVCYSCSIRLWEEGRKCPECREKITSFRHIFSVSDD